MKLDTLLIHLQAWAQEEHGAQARIAAVLAAQEEALGTGGTDTLFETGATLECVLAASRGRDQRRRDLLDGCARVFGVASSTLTLGSIVERAEKLGHDVTRLCTLRSDLRATTAEVVARSRRIVSVARYHQGVLAELLRILAAAPDEDGVEGRGALVDAEA